MKRKLLAAAMALLLLAGLCPTVSAEESEESAVIRIGSAQAFLAFADNCALDSWSQGARVQLLTDISLEGADFAPIPTFGGSFDGGGHTISGLSVTGNFSPAGLFGTLQPTAVVKNLKVSGVVAPDGDGMTVGGVVGENYGTVADCAFEGEVTGKTDTGGIAGANYGTVRSCTASGQITGSNRTGGIAGYSSGLIAACRNEMAVNTESVDPTIDPSDIHLNFNLDFSKTSNLDVSDAASDTGGIVGYTSGTVTGCVNTGAVGYPHIGYNLGGIAGRTSGFVEKCENQGTIMGRKDAGGIAGQIEPHIRTVLSPDYLETLSSQFENLGTLVNTAGSHAATVGGDVRDCLGTIAAYQNSARAALSDLASALTGNIGDIEIGDIEIGDIEIGDIEIGDGRIGTLPEIDPIQSLKDSIHALESPVRSLEQAVQGMVNSARRLQSVVAGGVGDISDDADAISDQIASISRTFAQATEDTGDETITDISAVDLSLISDGKVLSCTNSASVTADLNAGGITGIMGLESTADPEDDAPGGNLTQRRRYELKAIVQDCENLGTITGKRSYVGGICGRMELGLICDCRGYGVISSENGDYVGGIAGLTGGTIRGCLAKCTLSGGSYIGGIVGSGIAQDFSGDSSTVTGCYSMVEIPEYEQYAGAIAGVKTGVFTQNYFVSDTLAGINRVSYFAQAEPISYDALRRAETLPDTLKTLTLSFLVDGETVKTVPFHYGDSFDAGVFPELPQKEGCYAQWSTDDLTDLRFDTVVEAAYYPYITSLASRQTRPGDRPVLFVQGQFKGGDTLAVAPGTTAFGQPLLEQWRVSIPADGLENHTIRYLPTQENTAIYLLRNGSWNKVSTEAMGSYLAFEAVGAEVEFAVTAATGSGLRWVIPAAAALVLLLILGILLKSAKTRKNGKKRHWWILIFLLAVCAAAVCLYLRFPQTRAGQMLQPLDLLNAYLAQPEQQLRLTVKAQIQDTDAGFTAQIHRLPVGDTPVTVISEGGRRLYYAGGVVFLEDGAAFRLNSAAPDYAALMETVLEVGKQVDISALDGVFTFTAQDGQAAQILKLLMPSVQALLPEETSLTVDCITQDGSLSQLRFTAAGNLTDSVKTPFSLSATMEILPVSDDVTIPSPVAQAVSTGRFQAQELYSDDLVRLMDVWTLMRSKNPVSAQVTLEASCGELTVSDAFQFYQWKSSGAVIRGVVKDGTICYFTDNAICDENGRAVSTENPDLSSLLEIALGNVQNTEFTCRQQEDASVYTFTLNPEGMEQLMAAVFPKAENLAISCEEGSIRLVIADGSLQTVEITCGGSGKLLAATVAADFRLTAQLLNDSPGPALPEAVKQALQK